MPLVSIIIPCYNAAGTLADLLTALEDQIAPPSFEVIVSDNLSTDGLTAVTDRFRGRFERFEVVRADIARSRATARNIAVRHAAGRQLIFLDADDIPSRHLVRRLSDELEAHDVVISPMDATAFHGTDHPAAERLREVERRAADLEARRTPGDERFVLIGGSGLGVRTSAFYGIGDFQGRYRSSEDIEFGARAQLLGFDVARATGCLLHYRPRTTVTGYLRQQRQFGLGDVFMWSDYEHHQGAPLSFRSDARRFLGGILRLPRTAPAEVPGRLGAIVRSGSKVEGHLRYRWRSLTGLGGRHGPDRPRTGILPRPRR